MGFWVDMFDDAITVELRGWDRAMNARRRLRFRIADVSAARVGERGPLEDHIQHRKPGVGTHNGRRRPGRRRVGTMVGRDVIGRQFWAVSAGPPGTRLVVLELAEGPFARAVLEVDDPDAVTSLAHRTVGDV